MKKIAVRPPERNYVRHALVTWFAGGVKHTHVQSSSAELGHKPPGSNGSDSTNGVLSHVKIEGKDRSETSLLVELSGSTHETGTTECLNHPRHGRDFSTAQVGALEAVPVACSSRYGHFHFVGVNHHGDCLLSVFSGEFLGR